MVGRFELKLLKYNELKAELPQNNTKQLFYRSVKLIISHISVKVDMVLNNIFGNAQREEQ